jgi:hypothetical protein
MRPKPPLSALQMYLSDNKSRITVEHKVYKK